MRFSIHFCIHYKLPLHAGHSDQHRDMVPVTSQQNTDRHRLQRLDRPTPSSVYEMASQCRTYLHWQNRACFHDKDCMFSPAEEHLFFRCFSHTQHHHPFPSKSSSLLSSSHHFCLVGQHSPHTLSFTHLNWWRGPGCAARPPPPAAPHWRCPAHRPTGSDGICPVGTAGHPQRSSGRAWHWGSPWRARSRAARWGCPRRAGAGRSLQESPGSDASVGGRERMYWQRKETKW